MEVKKTVAVVLDSKDYDNIEDIIWRVNKELRKKKPVKRITISDVLRKKLIYGSDSKKIEEDLIKENSGADNE